MSFRQGARQFFERRGASVPYIMPDGGAYWRSGFNGGNGCEYVFDCLWKKWPRNYVDGLRVGNEFCIMAGHLYTGVVPCTFNWLATQRDTLTAQAQRKEARVSANDTFLNIRSVLRTKMRVGDNYIRIGFDGESPASTYASNVNTDSNGLYICGHAYDIYEYGSGHYDPMPSDTVMIFGIQIYQNGVLVKDYKPCLDNGVPCFLESVGNTKIHSDGATTGIYGEYEF